MADRNPDPKIVDVKAYPTLFPVKPEESISLGTGGVTGYGESHHGRAPGTVGKDDCVCPSEKPGIGVEVDEDFIAGHPVIEGSSYI